jgi:hypothetical protein
MILGFDASVVDHGSCVGGETGHCTTDMGIDFDDFFNRGGFEED